MSGWNKVGGAVLVLAAAGVSFTGLMLLTDEPRREAPVEDAPVVQAPADTKPGPEPASRDAGTTCDAAPAPPDQNEPDLIVPRPSTRKRRPPRTTKPDAGVPPTSKPAPVELQAVMTVRDRTPPPLVVITPRDRSYVLRETVDLRIQSEEGARVSAEGDPLLEQRPGIFTARIALVPGMNELRISALDAVGNKSQALVRITYIEPARYDRFKDRLASLLGQLDEIHQASLEIDVRTAVILRKLRDANDADEVTRLGREQREVQRAKRALQQEIEKAIMEIDMILARRR